MQVAITEKKAITYAITMELSRDEVVDMRIWLDGKTGPQTPTVVKELLSKLRAVPTIGDEARWA